MTRYTTAAKALKTIHSNSRIYLQAAAAAPSELIKALSCRGAELRNVEICQLHTEGEAPYANPALSYAFHEKILRAFKHQRSSSSACITKN